MRSRDEGIKKLLSTLEEIERNVSESKFDAFAKGDFADKLAPKGIYGKDSAIKASPKVERQHMDQKPVRILPQWCAC
jgi:hypothetical protein